MLRGLGWVVIVWYYPHFIPINFGSQYRYREALIVNKALGVIIIQLIDEGMEAEGRVGYHLGEAE